jgi:hypothetical protein
MNAKTFGTSDGRDQFAAKYGSGDYATVGHAIATEQRRNAGRFQVGSVPPVVRPRINRASEKAVDYLVSLSASRTPHVAEDVIRAWAATVDRSVVSDKIDELKAMLKSESVISTGGSLERHNVPAGRYAITGSDGQTVFVKVDRPTEGQWAGRIFVKIQAGDDLHRTGRQVADALLAKIAADGVQDAMLRYGREIGSCGHCGRTLTNQESRDAGIGPVCRDKMGW